MSDPIIFPDDVVDSLRERDMQFEDEPRSDWDKVKADREGWGWEMCPCGLMFYVERECQHGADFLALTEPTLCEDEGCEEENDWLLVARKRNSHAQGYDFQRHNLCDIHVWPKLDKLKDVGWECITPELF